MAPVAGLEGLERLVAACAAASSLDPGQLPGALVEALTDEGLREDDIAVLAVRADGSAA